MKRIESNLKTPNESEKRTCLTGVEIIHDVIEAPDGTRLPLRCVLTNEPVGPKDMQWLWYVPHPDWAKPQREGWMFEPLSVLWFFEVLGSMCFYLLQIVWTQCSSKSRVYRIMYGVNRRFTVRRRVKIAATSLIGVVGVWFLPIKIGLLWWSFMYAVWIFVLIRFISPAIWGPFLRVGYVNRDCIGIEGACPKYIEDLKVDLRRPEYHDKRMFLDCVNGYVPHSRYGLGRLCTGVSTILAILALATFLLGFENAFPVVDRWFYCGFLMFPLLTLAASRKIESIRSAASWLVRIMVPITLVVFWIVLPPYYVSVIGQTISDLRKESINWDDNATTSRLADVGNWSRFIQSRIEFKFSEAMKSDYDRYVKGTTNAEAVDLLLKLHRRLNLPFAKKLSVDAPFIRVIASEFSTFERLEQIDNKLRSTDATLWYIQAPAALSEVDNVIKFVRKDSPLTMIADQIRAEYEIVKMLPKALDTSGNKND